MRGIRLGVTDHYHSAKPRRSAERLQSGRCRVNRQPKAGEWWFSPDGEDRAFCCGVDGDGETLFEIEWNEFGKSIPDNHIHVPDCDGWDWGLPAMQEGYELCGPPADAETDAFVLVLEENAWCYCSDDHIGDGSLTYCRRKPADPGPQKQPSSVARIAAQLRQITKELEELKVSDGVDKSERTAANRS